MLLSLSFMQAIGVSIAAATLVGRYVGAGDREAVRRSFASALTLGVGLASVVGALFVALPGPLLRIFTDDPAVVGLGSSLLLLGAFFQLAERNHVLGFEGPGAETMQGLDTAPTAQALADVLGKSADIGALGAIHFHLQAPVAEAE